MNTSGTIRFINGCFQWCDSQNWIKLGGYGCNEIDCTWATLLVNTHSYLIPQFSNWSFYLGNTGLSLSNSGTLLCEQQFSCTNGLIASSWPESCTPDCTPWYTYSSSTNTCEPEVRLASCTWLADGAVWNDASAIYQSRNGQNWTPTTVASYSITGSLNECFFDCPSGTQRDLARYACITSTLAMCTGTLPSWALSTATTQNTQISWTYNTTPGICTYACASDLLWNTWSQTCCSPLPHAEFYTWSTGQILTALWSQNAWWTSIWGTVVINWQTVINFSGWSCNYVCDTWYLWSGTTQQCELAQNQCIAPLVLNTWTQTGCTLLTGTQFSTGIVSQTITPLWWVAQWWVNNRWTQTINGTTIITNWSTGCDLVCLPWLTWNAASNSCVAEQCTAPQVWNTWTQVCCTLPLNAFFFTWAHPSLWWQAVRSLDLWWGNTTNSVILTPNNTCNFSCLPWYVHDPTTNTCNPLSSCVWWDPWSNTCLWSP